MNGSVGWQFDNSYARLPKTFYTEQNPSPVKSPTLLKLNESLAESLGLDKNALQSEEGIAVLAGNKVPEGATPLAQAYAGHQFGHFNMLGDGRALLLGEQMTPGGERFDLQYKGSGRTPYSRGGDGRAALGPMLREYIMSEAMHALGVPTTRSLAVVATGEEIMRERRLPGAILTRVAASHIRVGTFQFAANWGSIEDLKALADYTISRHYPQLLEDGNRYLLLLKEVMNMQAELIAKWQQIGFIHGVMNTDNMTISGETIDYGPCAFMDAYDPATVFSSIDRDGRYAYGNQPYIGGWNLARFAETLVPLLHDDEKKAIELAQEAISSYPDLFTEKWLSGMRAKLGISNEESDDQKLIEELLQLMKTHRADFTNTFSSLTVGKFEDAALFKREEFARWKQKWQERLTRQKHSFESAEQLMMKANPVVIPRNHKVEEALEAAGKGDLAKMEELLDVLSNPYVYDGVTTEYCQPAPASSAPYRTFCGT